MSTRIIRERSYHFKIEKKRGFPADHVICNYYVIVLFLKSSKKKKLIFNCCVFKILKYHISILIVSKEEKKMNTRENRVIKLT